MADRFQTPVLDDHEHHLESGDGHDHDHALHVLDEEPLDPASESLSNALRASFRVLKFVMLIVAVLFLLSGVKRVDTREVAIKTTFGRQDGTLGPGLQWALPYPIQDIIRVSTITKSLPVDAFWLRLSDADKTKQLSELYPRGSGLDPAVDGALLTGDRGMMHLLCRVLYNIRDASLYVTNVTDEEALIRMVVQNAAVAESARTTADVVLKDPKELARQIQIRAQAHLDELGSGIAIQDVLADKSYYPLQVKEDFLAVSSAENKQRELIQNALAERSKKLNGVAGEAWEPLYEQIQRLEQIESSAQRDEVLATIGQILTQDATGEAGGKIKLAEQERERIVAHVLGEIEPFKAWLEAWKRDPQLVEQQLRQKMLGDLFSQVGVSKWFLPVGDKNIVLWLNADPIEARERVREELKSNVAK